MQKSVTLGYTLHFRPFSCFIFPLRNGGKFESKDSNQTKIDYNFYLRVNPAMILTELIATKLRNLETKVSLQDFLSELSIFVLEMSLYMVFLKGF